MEGHGRVRLGWVRRSLQVVVRFGKARHGGFGSSGYGSARYGKAVTVGSVGLGLLGRGSVSRSWFGKVWLVTAGRGGCGTSRLVEVRRGKVRRSWSGSASSDRVWCGQAVGVRFGKLGMSRRSMAWIGGLG